MSPIRNTIPRIKPIYPVYRVTEETFRIGGQFGITAEFDDPEGHVWALVQLMDGTRDFHALVSAMQQEFPSLSEDDIETGILLLDQEGFVENAAPASSAPGIDSGLERFAGNVNYFSHFVGLDGDREAVQKVLRRSKVVLLGLGGGGSNILPLLVASGIGRIVAVDYDRVELSNLNRQCLYRESDIGAFKTHVAERIVAEMNSAVDFSTITMKIESSDDVEPIIQGADLVICAIDEPPFMAQRRVNYACLERRVPCLYGLSQVSSGRMFSVLPYQSGCVDCLNIHYSKHDPLFVAQFRGFQEANIVGPTISFAPHMVRLSGMIAAEAVRLLTGYTEPQSIGKQVEFEFESGAIHTLTTWTRYDRDCPACGAGSEDDWPIFGLYPGQVSRAQEATTSGWNN